MGTITERSDTQLAMCATDPFVPEGRGVKDGNERGVHVPENVRDAQPYAGGRQEGNGEAFATTLQGIRECSYMCPAK